MSTPFECSDPPRATSFSMSTTLPLPSRTRAVIRLGRPKAYPPSWSTERALTWPIASPRVSMRMVPRRMSSWTRSRIRPARRMPASMACWMCSAETTSEPSSAAR